MIFSQSVTDFTFIPPFGNTFNGVSWQIRSFFSYDFIIFPLGSASHPSGFRNPCSYHLPDVSSSGRRLGQQVLLNRHEHRRMGGYASAEVQYPAPGMGDKSGGPVHDLLQHRFDPPTFGRMADGALSPVSPSGPRSRRQL